MSIDGIQVEWRPLICNAIDGPFRTTNDGSAGFNVLHDAVCLTINPSTGDVCVRRRWVVGRCRRVPSVDNTRCWHMVPVKWRLSLVGPGAGYEAALHFCFTFLLLVARPVAAHF